MRPAPLWRRYDRLLGSDPAADVKDELRFHLEAKVDDLVARGWHPEDASKEAERQFGNILAVQLMGERIGEYMDRRRRLTDYWADALWDLHFTLRTLGREAGFAVIAILILTLAIGANIAVFAVVNTLLLRPLPFPHPEQLVRLRQKDPKAGDSSMTYSTDAMQGFQQQNKSFQQVTGYFAFSGPDNVRLTGHGQPQPVTGMMVAGNFFSTLGVTPALGRNFTVEETLKNGRPVVLLSYPFWKRQYAGDTEIVGQTIGLDGAQVTVVGVLPDTFDFGAVFAPGSRVDLFTPAILGEMEDWGNTMALVGRLKPGVTLGGAQAEANSIFPRLLIDNKHRKLAIVPMQRSSA